MEVVALVVAFERAWCLIGFGVATTWVAVSASRSERGVEGRMMEGWRVELVCRWWESKSSEEMMGGLMIREGGFLSVGQAMLI